MLAIRLLVWTKRAQLQKNKNMYMSNKSSCEALFESFQMVTFWIFITSPIVRTLQSTK